MPIYNVTVNADGVILPNGRLYDDTDTAQLTEEQFLMIDPANVGASPLIVTLDGVDPLSTEEVPAP